MKHGILIFLAASAMTGVAGAQILRPSPVPDAASQPKAEAAPQVKPNVVNATPATATLSIRQAPVPMQRASRPSAVRDTDALESARPDTNRPETASPESVAGLSDAHARAAIEADGYKRVRVIGKAENGTWRVVAMRGTNEVTLRVDAQGNVVSE
jgi:hypothetical protein